MSESHLAPTRRSHNAVRRRRRPSREAGLWPRITAIGFAGLLLAVTGLTVRHYTSRGHTPTAEEIAPTAPAAPTRRPPLRPQLDGQHAARNAKPKESFTSAAPRRQPAVIVEGFKYRTDHIGVGGLISDLEGVPEVGLRRGLDDDFSLSLVNNARTHSEVARQFHPLALLVPDMHSLPLRMEFDCQLSRDAAETLQTRSRQLRAYLAASPTVATLRRELDLRADVWQDPSAIPTLMQMLSPEKAEWRRLLLVQLSRIQGREASRALARRAIFETNHDLRQVAVNELLERPVHEFRDILFEGLRYPWAPIADFAATALIRLGNYDSPNTLIGMLDQDAPGAPFTVMENGTPHYYVREMVRINHLRNCAVCHAMSFDESHLVRAAAPDPKKPLPPAFTPAYYKPQPDQRQLFVLADVTYLRQDFSEPLTVSDPGPWPYYQRFDFCVRTRRLSREEWEELSKKPAPNPQRESILFALRELTGQDHGESSAEWRKVLGPN
jgi:hypothetical protein